MEKCFLRSDADSASPAIAAACAQAQLAYYRLLEQQGHLRIVVDSSSLSPFRGRERAVPGGVRGLSPIPTISAPATSAPSPGHGSGAAYAASSNPKSQIENPQSKIPPSCILLMEGADPITAPCDLAWWHQQGVRALSLTHTETNAFATGNHGDALLAPAGVALLEEMDRLQVALDLSHLCDASFAGVAENFRGRWFASHANCRSICPGARQISDEMIRAIAQRDGVIGMVWCNSMIRAGLKLETYNREMVQLEHLVQHIDHICQLTGSSKHVGIGSDLDGGFGVNYTPVGLDTIADLQQLAPELSRRGYSNADIAGIMHGNWLRFWGASLATDEQR